MTWGQTGSWYCVPVTLCVGLIGALLIYQEADYVVGRWFSRAHWHFLLHDTGNLKGRSWSPGLNLYYPGLRDLPPLTWLENLTVVERSMKLFTGVWAVVLITLPHRFFAYFLYILLIVTSTIWVFNHLFCLRCYRKEWYLEFDEKFRKSDTAKSEGYYFGVSTWPGTFWYQWLIQIAVFGSTVYQVLNLFYSYYLILRVGGSGWEFQPAKDLPGWSSYIEQKLKKRRERKKKLYGEDYESSDEGSEAEALEREKLVHAPDPNVQQIQAARKQALQMKMGRPVEVSPQDENQTAQLMSQLMEIRKQDPETLKMLSEVTTNINEQQILNQMNKFSEENRSKEDAVPPKGEPSV